MATAECDYFGIRWIGIQRPPCLEYLAPDGSFFCRAYPIFVEDTEAKVRTPVFDNRYRMSSNGGPLNGCRALDSMEFTSEEEFRRRAHSIYTDYALAYAMGNTLDFLRSLGFKN